MGQPTLFSMINTVFYDQNSLITVLLLVFFHDQTGFWFVRLYQHCKVHIDYLISIINGFGFFLWVDAEFHGGFNEIIQKWF